MFVKTSPTFAKTLQSMLIQPLIGAHHRFIFMEIGVHLTRLATHWLSCRLIGILYLKKQGFILDELVKDRLYLADATTVLKLNYTSVKVKCLYKAVYRLSACY